MAKGDRANLERLLRRAWERQTALLSQTKKPREGHDTGLVLAIFSGLAVPLVYVLQANGVVEIRWWISALIYLMIICFAVWEFRQWNVPRNWRPLRRVFTYLIGCTMLLILSGLGVRTEYVREHTSSTSELVIEASYDLDLTKLPIPVAPYSSVYIVRILKDRRVEGEFFYNERSTVHLWPTDKRIFPPDGVGTVKLINHGKVDVFNVLYKFNMRIGSQKGLGGITSVEMRLPLVDLPISSPRSVYIVDQSGLGGIVDLSDQATGEIQGNRGRTQISLTVRAITFFDKLPMLPLTQHHWDGDKLLDPNIFENVGSKKHRPTIKAD
jgi:hypothetical protein